MNLRMADRQTVGKNLESMRHQFRDLPRLPVHFGAVGISELVFEGALSRRLATCWDKAQYTLELSK